MIERKCLKCQTWNQDERFCKNCSAPLSPEEILKEEEVKRAEWQARQPKPKLDILLDKAKNSRYLIIRILFYFFYSIALIVFGIGSFVAYLVAWSPG